MEKKPLVVEGGQVQQMQPGQEIAEGVLPANIALTQDVLVRLIDWMLSEGFEIPLDILEDINSLRRT